MNELSKHISRLLERNECVILPGLGGFVTTHAEATYDDEKGIFSPPRRTLAFQAGLTTDDGLLAQSFMDSNDLTYPEAVALVAQKVAYLKDLIARNSFYDLKGIGRLSQDLTGHYYFSANGCDFHAPEFYGLQPISVQKLSDRPVERPVQVVMPVEHTPVAAAPAYPFYSKKGISIHFSTSTINKIAGIVIMFLLVFLFATPFGTLKPSTFYSGFATLMSDDRPKPVRKMVVRKDLLNRRFIKKDTTAAKPTAPAPVEDNYCIVLASGITRANGEEYIKRLSENGVKARLLEKGNMRRVVYSSYKTKEEAQSALNSLRSSDKDFSSAWVLKNH